MPLPAFLAAAAPAIVSSAASLVGTIYSNESKKSESRRAFNAEKDFSTWLLRNQTQEKVRDMRSAGLNPAFENGSQLGASPSSPSYNPAQIEAPDFTNSFLWSRQLSDIQLQNAQKNDLIQSAEQKRLDNERQQIENARLRSEDKNAAQYLREHAIDFETLDGWFDTHPNELPDAIAIADVGASGALSAKQKIAEYERIVQDVDVNEFRNRLEKLVLTGQINEPKVVQALEYMPLYAYRELVAKTRNVLQSTKNLNKEGEILDIRKVTEQLEQDITRDSNINQYVNKLFSGDFTMSDFVKLIIRAFSGVMLKK